MRQHRPVIEPANLEGDIGKRKHQRAGRDGVGVACRTMARHRVGQQQRQHRRKRIAEQQQVDEAAADVLPPQHRVLQPQQSEQAGQPGEAGQQHRADIVDDAAAAQAQPLQPDRHRKRNADLQCDLRQPGAVAIDIAAIDRVADLHEGEQHREQDRRRLDHSQRHVVGVAAQEMAAGPE